MTGREDDQRDHALQNLNVAVDAWTTPAAYTKPAGEPRPSRAATGRGWRTTWPVVTGMPNRAAGCRLVGNSLVPAIVLAIYQAIEAVEQVGRTA